MGEDAALPASHDPAARGYDGRLLPPACAPAPVEAPSPGWLAQLGRAPIGDYAGGREVLKRLTDGALTVPGDDPLYQYLGAQRVFAEVLQAQHDEQMGRMQAMLDEARLAMAQLLADVGAAGTAALAARRAEDDAALTRFSARLEDQAAAAARTLREAMAEERNAMTAAVAVLTSTGSEKPSRAGPGGPWRPFGDVGARWAARCRWVAAWAALLALSVIAGMALLWALGRFGPAHGGR